MHSCQFRFFRLWLCLFLSHAFAESEDKQIPPPLDIRTGASIAEDDGVRVSILGYHDFSRTLKETEMRINTDKFRRQMQALKDQAIPVISMIDFQAWKRGEKQLPARAAVITIDDGWLSVYTDAFPILKEFKYPFTVFLYTKYIDVGGKSMTSKMIEEMKNHGATIGCHSHTHPYPGTVRKYKAKGTTAYQEFLSVEMQHSKQTLEKNFGQTVTTYCYPGGFHTPEMFDFAGKIQYQHSFTVLPGKVKRSSDDMTLPRYIILGTHDHIFTLATEFPSATLAQDNVGAQVKQHLPYPVLPEPGMKINTRTPMISANLSDVTDMDVTSLSMRIAGFGEVPAKYDEQQKTFSWKVNRRLRTDSCQVSITWKKADGKVLESPLRWSFLLDREAAYQPINK